MILHRNPWEIHRVKTILGQQIMWEEQHMNLKEDRKLSWRLINIGRTNLNKWFENILEKLCEDQEIEERTSLNNKKRRFYTYMHDNFFYQVPNLFHIFLIEKGLVHMVEGITSLLPPLSTDL